MRILHAPISARSNFTCLSLKNLQVHPQPDPSMIYLQACSESGSECVFVPDSNLIVFVATREAENSNCKQEHHGKDTKETDNCSAEKQIVKCLLCTHIHDRYLSSGLVERAGDPEMAKSPYSRSSVHAMVPRPCVGKTATIAPRRQLDCSKRMASPICDRTKL